MKKTLLWGAIASLFFVSCSKNEMVESIESSCDFVAQLADVSRTELDGTAVIWNAEDELTIFTKTMHNRHYKVKTLSEDGRTATFGFVDYTGTSNGTISANYAVYPYDAQATLSGDVISTVIASEQQYDAEKVDLSYALMAAKSESNSFAFVNAGALMRFNVSKSELIPDSYTLNSIKLSSAANNIAGDVTIDLSAESRAVVASTGTKQITLTAINQEITTEAKAFYVALPAVSFTDKELTVTFTFADGEKSFALPAFDLLQGSIKTIAYQINDADDFTGTTPDSGEDFEGETPGEEAVPANNEIWYTTSDSKTLSFPYSYVFDANITSNVYEDGKGVITFDSDVTMLVEAFERFENLLTVSLPNSVTTLNSYAFSHCSNLNKITLGNGVTTIDGSAIVECPNISKIGGGGELNDGHCIICNGTLHYIFGLEGLTSYSIPAGVNTISLNATPESTTLTKLTIPNSVTSINSLILRGFGALKSFAGKFASEDGSCLVIDGNLSYFATVALEGLTSYSVPNNVNKISANFVSTTLRTVALPESVTEISATVFQQCPNLESISGSLATADGKCLVVDNTIIKLVDKKISSYNIPEGISAIGETAFDSSNISTITVPASVSRIGDCAFHSSSITEIYFKSTTPASISSLFNPFLVTNVKLYVPTEVVDAYKTAEDWSLYVDYIEPYNFAI